MSLIPSWWKKKGDKWQGPSQALWERRAKGIEIALSPATKRIPQEQRVDWGEMEVYGATQLPE